MKIGRLYPILLILSISLIVITFATLLRSFSSTPASVVALAQPKQEQPVAVATSQEVATLATSAIKPTPSYDPTFPPTPKDTPIPADSTPTPDPTLHPELFPTSSFAPEFGEVDMRQFASTEEAFDLAKINPKPSDTPLPTISPNNLSKFASQNIKFQLSEDGVPDLLRKPNSTGEIAWSLDGKFLAASVMVEDATSSNGQFRTFITIFDADGNLLQRLVEGFNPIWSPSGQYIAYYFWNFPSATLEVNIINVNDHQIFQLTTISQGVAGPSLTWLSDQEILYFQDTVILFNLTANQKSKALPDDLIDTLFFDQDIAPLQLAISALPQQNLIAVSNRKAVDVFRYEPSTLTLLQQFIGVDTGTPLFSADGKALAYVADKTRQLTIVSLTDAAVPTVELPRPSRSVPFPFVWSPDGASLIYRDADGMHIVNRDGSGWRTLPPTEISGQITWSSLGIVSYVTENTSMLNLMPVSN